MKLEQLMEGVPFTLVNSRAGALARKARRWMAASSKCGSTSASMRTRWPLASKSCTHS